MAGKKKDKGKAAAALTGKASWKEKQLVSEKEAKKVIDIFSPKKKKER